MNKSLIKLADDLEQKYWENLFDSFSAQAKAIWEASPANFYLMDNSFQEHENEFSVDLVLANKPEVSFQKPDISKEQLIQLLVNLGKAFKNQFPSSKFDVSDDKETNPKENLYFKNLKITVSKNDVK